MGKCWLELGKKKGETKIISSEKSSKEVTRIHTCYVLALPSFILAEA